MILNKDLYFVVMKIVVDVCDLYILDYAYTLPLAVIRPIR